MAADERSSQPVWVVQDERDWPFIVVDTGVFRTCMGVHEFAVYCALIAHAKVRTGLARPSEKTIAAYFCISERRVRSAVQWLEENRWITVERTLGRASKYTVLPPPTPAQNAGVLPLDPGTDFRGPRHVVPETPEQISDELELGTKTKIENSSASGYPDAFERFWQVYPQRKAKRAALKAWRSARKRTTEYALLEGARVYAATTDPRYYKHPATWLNADAWLDECAGPTEESAIHVY